MSSIKDKVLQQNAERFRFSCKVFAQRSFISSASGQDRIYSMLDADRSLLRDAAMVGGMVVCLEEDLPVFVPHTKEEALLVLTGYVQFRDEGLVVKQDAHVSAQAAVLAVYDVKDSVLEPAAQGELSLANI